MHAKSHYHLGQYLIRQHLQHKPRHYRLAFLIGCLEPDKNPVTYLKGSIRCHFLRGHHWTNSQRYIQKISARLENRPRLRLLDFYTLGKLIHYTTDAFTFSHNEAFSRGLAAHRAYERRLQEYFLHYLECAAHEFAAPCGSVMETIRMHHSRYSIQPEDIRKDCIYAVGVSRGILAQLISQPLLCK